MREHEQHTAFLKALINHQSPGETCRSLEEKLTDTISRERCVRRAIVGVLILAALSGAGLGYSLVLIPAFAQDTSSIALKVFKITGLASAICLAFFLPLLGQTRRQLRNLHRLCRQAIIGSFQTPSEACSGRIGKIESVHPAGPARFLRRPKIS